MKDQERIVIKNTDIITPYRILKQGTLVIENGKIAAVNKGCDESFCDGAVYDAKGSYSAPGFIDIHTHGAGGCDFADGTPEAFTRAAKTQLAHGTTLLLPTVAAAGKEHILSVIAAYQKAKQSSEYGNMLYGLHMEGPYFAMEQRGALDPVYIRNPEEKEYREILEQGDCIVRWSAAPELPGALEFGRYLREKNILPSIGHSDAVYDQVADAYESGFTLATHLFSGMSTIKRIHSYRHLGAVESALYFDEMDVELICDGSHLPAELVKMVYQIKGPSRIALITDSIRAAGTQATESILGNERDGIRVIVEDRVAKLPDRSSFAGSVATADWLLRFAWKEAGIPLTDAVRMLTSTPARIIGIEKKKGKLAPGMDADLVLFDENGNLEKVMLGGKWAA